MEEKKNKKKYLVIGLLIVVLLLGVSYALFTITLFGKKKVSIIADKLELVLDESETEGIEIKGAVPIEDKEGIKGKVYKFSIENKGNRDIEYQVYLDTDSEAMKECSKCEELREKDIRYEISIEGQKTIETLDAGRMIDRGVIKGNNDKKNYELKIWLNYDADNEAQNKVFYGKIRVNGSQVINNYENGTPNSPVLSDNMIPVVYNGYNWVKADTNSRWYDYERQNWANAVTVTNDSRSSYQSAKAGTKVNMEDILQMYVWIPRYSYTIKQPYGKQEIGRETIPTQALPGEIDVKFISSSTTDEGSAQYTGDTAEGWFTPPGFTFGEKNLSGIWIGKFETGYSEGTGVGVSSTTDAQKDIIAPNQVIIKPNVYSWRGIRVSTLDLVSRQITNDGNVFGFDQSTYDTHASKNTEWALISYLTQSKYGKYGNPLYTGENKEVYRNNYSGYLTGCSSGNVIAESSENCIYQYDNTTSYGEGQGYIGAGASSTGNITGIYDINGGAWEYTMGVLEKRSGNTQGANSGYPGLLADGETFTSDREWPNDKYYNVYTSINPSTACNGVSCKGFSLNEVTGWYSDWTDMLVITFPWMVRGGSHYDGIGTGVFAYGTGNGAVNLNISFRQVLVPNN